MERRERDRDIRDIRDDGVTISALQLGLLRSYNHLLQPPGFASSYSAYSANLAGEPQKGGVGSLDCHSLVSKIELAPLAPISTMSTMLGAFQPYAALHFSSDPHPDLKTVTPLVSPILVGTSGLCGRRIRGEKKAIPEEQKDERYFERRKRNNQAAKKSRDARKLREDQIALRATILEHENAMLRSQILALRDETQALRRLLLLHNKGDRAVPQGPRIANRSPPYHRKDGFD